MKYMSVQFETKIETYDVHPNNNARISAIFKLFQKVAGDDMDSTGVTYDVLRDRNIAFVLTKMNIHFYDDIKTYDDVKIITRPRGCKGVTYIRDYDVFVNDKRVAYCTSQWVIIDFEKRRVLRPNTIAEDFRLQDDLTDIVELDDKKIRLDIKNLTKTDVRNVYYSHIDKNEHMNNTFYPDIVYDYVPDEYKQGFKDKTFIIQYTTEIKCGEQMEIYTGLTDDGFAVVAKNVNTDKEVFSAVIQ